MFIGSKPKDLFPRQNKAAADFYRRQQQKKIHAKGPYLVQRSFRRNEGTTDHATIPEVTLTGDFVIEFDLLSQVSTQSQNVMQLGNFLIRLQSDTELRVWGDLNATQATFIIPNVGRKFNRFRISGNVLSNNITLTINGVLVGVEFSNGLPNFAGSARLLRYLDNYFQGILANLKIWDNGTLIRDYPLDDNSDDLRELASGQNGTVINGNASDWGLFQQQATGEWLGQELVDTSAFIPTPEWEVDGGKVSKVGDTSSNFDIAPVQANRSYLNSVFKEAENTGSPNLRVGGTQVLFPWLVQGTPAGTYPFTISTPISGVLAFNGTGSRFVVSQISVKEVLNVA